MRIILIIVLFCLILLLGIPFIIAIISKIYENICGKDMFNGRPLKVVSQETSNIINNSSVDDSVSLDDYDNYENEEGFDSDENTIFEFKIEYPDTQLASKEDINEFIRRYPSILIDTWYRQNKGKLIFSKMFKEAVYQKAWDENYQIPN